VQNCLRDWFAKWGQPAALRVDNGTPWGSKGDLPTDLALWLIGLGIEMIWNPPRQPQKNGVIERSQGTGKRWAEPSTCRTPEELQIRLNELDAIHREEYPVHEGKSRSQLFPDLRHSGRDYVHAQESERWDWDRVGEHLKNYVIAYKVDSSGQVSIYKRNHYVGKAYSGLTVYNSFDPLAREWVFRDARGNQLRTRPAPELEAASIRSLQVIHRNGKTDSSTLRDTN
jgi:transposase InsO family protein